MTGRPRRRGSTIQQFEERKFINVARWFIPSFMRRIAAIESRVDRRHFLLERRKARGTRPGRKAGPRGLTPGVAFDFRWTCENDAERFR
jgi:hypothetical protein